MTTAIDKLTMLFEALVVIAVISGFVVQQFRHHRHVGLGRHPSKQAGGA